MRGKGEGTPLENWGERIRPPGVRDRGAEGQAPKAVQRPPLLTWQLPGLAFHPSEKEEEPAAGSKLR